VAPARYKVYILDVCAAGLEGAQGPRPDQNTKTFKTLEALLKDDEPAESLGGVKLCNGWVATMQKCFDRKERSFAGRRRA
jgi:hypothetical protein